MTVVAHLHLLLLAPACAQESAQDVTSHLSLPKFALMAVTAGLFVVIKGSFKLGAFLLGNVEGVGMAATTRGRAVIAILIPSIGGGKAIHRPLAVYRIDKLLGDGFVAIGHPLRRLFKMTGSGAIHGTVLRIVGVLTNLSMTVPTGHIAMDG